jgi:hypothetical protein
MKLRSLFVAALTAIGITAASNASAIIVGGIDFGAIGTVSHLETTTVAETLVTQSGDPLLGYGQVNTVNGDSTYCAVDPNCRLFFSFTYTTDVFTGLAATFESGTVTIYYDPGTGGVDTGATRNLLNFDSPTNLAYITGLTEWVTLSGHDFLSLVCGALAGDPISEVCATSNSGNVNVSFTGTGLLDVLLGGPGLADVIAYLNGNSEVDGLGGFADITFNTSGSSTAPNPNDTCSLPTAVVAGEWCIQGSADIRGSVAAVPEPDSLALMGIGLLAGGLGFVGAARRKRRV